MSNVGAKVLMVATASQKYGGRSLHMREEFEVDSEEDAADLIAIGFAIRAENKSAAVKRSTQKGSYQRRDMRAKK